MLRLSVLAVFSTLSFAQTDVTNKVLNPDAEKGMLGWDVTFIDGGQIWNKQTSRPSIRNKTKSCKPDVGINMKNIQYICTM